MTDKTGKYVHTVVGIMGSHRDDAPAMNDAFTLGEAVARRGHILLTGGGPGIMRAASEGACRAGGLVMAILPNDRGTILPGYPNEFVHIPVYTGMGDARNVINAKTSRVIIALSGGPGTLSEIALALKAGTPVITFKTPFFEVFPGTPLYPAATLEEVLTLLDRLLPHTGDD